MALHYQDVAMVNNALGDLGDTLLKNRMMNQEQQRYQQQQANYETEHQRLMQNAKAEQDYRNRSLAGEEKHRGVEEDLARQRLKLESDRSKGTFYLVDPESGNAIQSAYGSAEEANAEAQKMSQKVGKQVFVSDKFPENKIKGKIKNPVTGEMTDAYMDAEHWSTYETKLQPHRTAMENNLQQLVEQGVLTEEEAGNKLRDWTDRQIGGVKKPDKTETMTIEEKYPAVDAKEAYISHDGLFGTGAAITNSPATPYQPERIVRRTVPANPVANIPGSELPNLSGQGAASAKPKPTPEDIQYLQSNPHLYEGFNKKFGEGAANAYLP